MEDETLTITTAGATAHGQSLPVQVALMVDELLVRPYLMLPTARMGARVTCVR